MKFIRHTIPIYYGYFYISYASSQEELEQLQKKFKIVKLPDDFDLASCSAFSYAEPINGYNRYFIFLHNHRNNPGIIAHECAHVADSIFSHIEAALDPENDEPYCYLLGWLVNKVHKFNSSYNK